VVALAGHAHQQGNHAGFAPTCCDFDTALRELGTRLYVKPLAISCSVTYASILALTVEKVILSFWSSITNIVRSLRLELSCELQLAWRPSKQRSPNAK